MIIGVDAGALSISDERLKVGVWRVTHELVKRLPSVNKNIHFRLYSFAPIPKDAMEQFGNNVQNVILTPPMGYMKIRLPLELIEHPVDCFLGVSQALPDVSMGKKISFIYDLGFLILPSLYGTSASKLKHQTAFAVQKADRIITISKSVKKEIHRTYSVPEERINVCYPGVSDCFKSYGKTEKLPYPYFLFVGSLWKGKNITSLLSAFNKFCRTTELPHHLLLVGGDYWNTVNFNEIIQRLHLTGRVHVLGHVSDERLAQLYRGAQAFVTMTQTEGFCIPMVEACVSGCPVIASGIDVIKEIAGKSGYLVDPNNTNKFADAMRDVASDSVLRKKLNKRGLEEAKKYSWNKFTKDVYSSIVV